MPVGRIILKSISDSKKLSKVKTDGARLLYTWLITHLDVNGCYSGDAQVINGKIFTRLNKSNKTVENYLCDLEENNLIIRYEINGDLFLNVPDFKEKQPSLNPEREGKTNIPLPPPDLLQSKSRVTPLKDKISKDKISKDKFKVIFDYWNKKQIIVHKDLDQQTESKINSILKNYDLKEIKQAIHNYWVILTGEEYWFKYKWTLKEFLQRGFEKFKDEDIAHGNYLKDNKK